MASRKPLLRKNNDTDGEEIQEEVIVHYERSQESSTGSTSTDASGPSALRQASSARAAAAVSKKRKEKRRRLRTNTEELLEVEKTAEDDAAGKGNALLLSFLAMVIVGLGNKLFQIFETIPMHNYPFFLSLMTTFIYIPLSFAYIIPMQMSGKISQENTSVPKKVFFVMGLLDGLAGILQQFATNYITKRPLVILLQQTAIPISMLISKRLLKAKYVVWQYLGATIVMAGLVVVLVPSFAEKGAGAGAVQAAWVQPVWSLVMALSSVPMCLSSVYKEKKLGEAKMDVVYLNGWVAIFQFLISIPLAIPAAYASGLSISDIPSNLYGGLKCYAGVNSIVNTTASTCYPLASHEQPVCDNCSTALLYVTIYILFNVSYNILIILILKFGSSNILWLSMTIMVPLGNVAFYIPSIPGHMQPKWEDIVGLLILVFGLITYRFADKMYKKFIKKERRLSITLDDEEEHEAATRVSKLVTATSVSFGGEAIQNMVQVAAQATTLRIPLLRSPELIRSSYLMKLGVGLSPTPPPERMTEEQNVRWGRGSASSRRFSAPTQAPL